jgi:hypothetical protein
VDCQARSGLRDLHGDAQALAERLDALEQDHERVLVLGNFGVEAWREAVDRRRAMLGDAAVAAVISELSAAELAPIERTIRMLDPEDLELRALDEAGRSALDEMAAIVALVNDTLDFLADRRAEVLQLGYLGGANLVAAGCVRAWDFSPRILELLKPSPAPIQSRGAQVTPLGELVLRFMGRARDEMPVGVP